MNKFKEGDKVRFLGGQPPINAKTLEPLVDNIFILGESVSDNRFKFNPPIIDPYKENEVDIGGGIGEIGEVLFPVESLELIQ